MEKTTQSNDMLIPESFESGTNVESKNDEVVTRISDLSKKGYQLLKDNDIQGAKKPFQKFSELKKTTITHLSVWVIQKESLII